MCKYLKLVQFLTFHKHNFFYKVLHSKTLILSHFYVILHQIWCWVWILFAQLHDLFTTDKESPIEFCKKKQKKTSSLKMEEWRYANLQSARVKGNWRTTPLFLLNYLGKARENSIRILRWCHINFMLLSSHQHCFHFPSLLPCHTFFTRAVLFFSLVMLREIYLVKLTSRPLRFLYSWAKKSYQVLWQHENLLFAFPDVWAEYFFTNPQQTPK